MAIAHVFIRHHTVGTSRGTGAQVVHYLERTHQYAGAVQATVEYLDRRGTHTVDRQDLVDHGVVNFPGWSGGSAERFFEAAYTHERANGRWATSWQCSLPNELSVAEQKALTLEFLATHLPNRPTLWVMHNQRTDSGEQNPHIHILFSERLQDGIERDAAQTFKRYNRAHPERGGARKMIFGEGDRQAPDRLRESWCASVNMHLERAGVQDAWLDPRSLNVRGVDRHPVRYVYEDTDTHKLEARLLDERTPATRAQEAALAAQWWADYKRSMGITPAHLHNSQVVLQMLAREVRDPGTRAQELRPAAAVREPGLDQPLVGNCRSKIYHLPGDPNYGDVQPRYQVLFWSRSAAEEAGYRAAMNQQYGPGARERMQALETEVQTLERYLRTVQVEHRVERAYAARGQVRPRGGQQRVEQLLAHGRELGLDGDSPSPAERVRERVAALRQRRQPARQTGRAVARIAQTLAAVEEEGPQGRGLHVRLHEKEQESGLGW